VAVALTASLTIGHKGVKQTTPKTFKGTGKILGYLYKSPEYLLESMVKGGGKKRGGIQALRHFWGKEGGGVTFAKDRGRKFAHKESIELLLCTRII